MKKKDHPPILFFFCFGLVWVVCFGLVLGLGCVLVCFGSRPFNFGQAFKTIQFWSSVQDHSILVKRALPEFFSDFSSRPITFAIFRVTPCSRRMHS